ncbi:MAG: type II secretion system inner membrane protein GspF [Candidatus Brocadiia bacterium]
MPIYSYKAVNSSGKNTGGVIDADTPKDARSKLRSQGLLPTELHETHADKRKSLAPRIFRPRAEAETASFTRQLATLTKSGIPVADALSVLREQVESAGLERTIMDVHEQVLQGTSLADALARHPRYFSDLYVNMVRSGEEAGTLDIVLDRIAEYLQKRHRLSSKIQATMAYPIVVVFFGTAIVIFLLTFVVPKIANFLEQAKKPIPLPTWILMLISRLLAEYWYFLVIAAVLIFFAIRAYFLTKTGRRFKDRMMLNLPIIGPLFRKTAVSRFALTFSTLLKSGVPALKGLEIVGKVVDNVVLEETIAAVHDRIIEGADISTPLKQSGVFPPVVGYMIAVGERTGRLEEVLDRIAEAYDEEVEIAAQKLMSLLEPIFIVVLAIVVGLIVMSVILPILELSRLK